MVGVPGRSKGCNTCIQRKVKCDGGQPTCGNCRKSNRLCTGYKRPVAFVMSADVALTEPMAADEPEGMSVTTQGRWRRRPRKLPEALPADRRPRGKAAKKDKTASKNGLEVDLDTTVSPAELKRYKKAFGSAGIPDEDEHVSWTSVVGKTQTTTTAMTMVTSSSPWTAVLSGDAAWREQLFPVFLDLHLPDELLQGCARGRGQRPRNWLMHLPHTALDGSPALETAMAALCMARVGRQSGSAGLSLVRHSLDLYTRGLGQLQRAVQDPRTRRSDQTLAACLTLSMYELAECPTGRSDGYLAHQDGSLALLQMRGPDAHASPLAHSLFNFLRIQNFIYAIMNRQSNFFSTPAWLQRPWKDLAKDPHDRFMDQMYAIPVLMEQSDALAASDAVPDRLAAGYSTIIARYVDIDTCLQKWQRDLKLIVSGPLYWPELSAIRCPVFDDSPDGHASARGRPFPVAFHFPAFFIGQSVILYWLIVLFVNVQMDHLYRRIAVLEDAAAAVPVPVPWDCWTLSPTFSNLPELDLEPLSPSTAPPVSSPASTLSTSATPPSTSPPSSAPPPSVSPLAAADSAASIARTMTSNICQSIEYFLQDSMGDIGSVSTLLPLTAVRYHLSRTHSTRPCPPGPPEHPGEYSDEVVWVDFLIQFVGGKGHRMAFYITAD
ncbi:c6 zinc finger domain containing protein [Grosmannia clavigera kw1407]|uniref:C6 zinc finger domain containing protein n=1 Tax=Grosmannia clavigera (strain kw1407 / UAMH 11150) TaxID=655863 RepID=F0XPB5_GROCL|nr:c6 zinc finger domain containing protein [Grosmannia clavigera kw1407]EFX00323.1 c6 zinc finger domain containing protein [Grosmannia clavigera kw1407]